MNYSEIVSLALSYADRSDTEVTSRVDDFLRVVESRATRLMKVQRMVARTATPTVAGQEYYALPTDFGGIRDIEIRDTLASTDRTTLHYLAPEQMNAYANSTDTRLYYTIIANQIQIMPTSDNQVLEIVYYRRIPELSSTATTNWLSETNPDIYVFGLLVEISAFVKDPEAGVMWDRRFNEAITQVTAEDSVSRWSGPMLTTRYTDG